MFGLFRRKKTEKIQQLAIQMADINNNPLKEGDLVESLRYELGKCKVLKTEEGYSYESMETGEQVSFLRMVDASTELQKVKKI